MADNQQQEAPNANDRVSVGIEQDTTSVSFDGSGTASTSQHGDSLNQSFDEEGNALSPEDIAELEADGDQPDAGDPDADAEGDAPEEEATEGDEPAAELPEWDAESDEVNTAYDAKYITKDEAGKDVLNFEAFNAEFAVDRGEGKRDLNAGTRAYLKDRFGISDQLIDSHLAGVIAQERVIADTFHLQFGGTPEEGQKAYTEMFGWAKANFTPQQKARYNAAMKEGGEAALEQIELLKTRYLTKNPKAVTEGKPAGIGLKPRRATSPKKDAASGERGSGKGPSPFANAEEHRVAQNAALQLTGKEKTDKLAEVRERLLVSNFWRA